MSPRAWAVFGVLVLAMLALYGPAAALTWTTPARRGEPLREIPGPRDQHG